MSHYAVPLNPRFELVEAAVPKTPCAITSFSVPSRWLTVLVNRSDGTYSGELRNVPPTGETRAQILADYCEAEGLKLEESVAYADSTSDLPMLEAVGFAVAVNPEVRLAALARKRGFLPRRRVELRRVIENKKLQRPSDAWQAGRLRSRLTALLERRVPSATHPKRTISVRTNFSLSELPSSLRPYLSQLSMFPC